MKNKGRVGVVAWLLSIIGALIYICAEMCLKYVCLTESIMKTIVSILASLAMVIFSAGVVSIGLEYASILDVSKRAIESVLTADFNFSCYSVDILFSLRDKITKYLLGLDDNTKIDETIYSLEKKLFNEVNNIYYDFHKATFVIYPNENSGFIEMQVSTRYRIVNIRGENVPFAFKFRSLIDDTNSNPETLKMIIKDKFDFEIFKVNGKDIDDYKNFMIVEIDTNKTNAFYNYKVKFDMDLGAEKTIDVELEYKVRLQIDDIEQNYRLSRACKRLEHAWVIRKDSGTGLDWNIRSYGYNNFYVKQDSNTNPYEVRSLTETSSTIDYEDWSLPGAGYSVLFTKKR